jgi:hypothetical protein
VGSLSRPAHSLQRAPTGVSTMHLGQMGLAHLPQVSPVSTSGCVAHLIWF